MTWWAPEYTVLPEGIEDCPIPSVAILGDWSVNAWATFPTLDAFDLVLTDRLGVETLTQAGLRHVDHWRCFTFEPTLHRVLPGLNRDIDILFVSNLNLFLYPDRAQWLHRIAALSPRYRVVITGGIYDEDYVRLLNRARIVFNRSMRGEMNMRTYEAAAAGAVLFIERENLEIRNVFEDRIHCVLYGDDDLERLLEYYLTHDAERGTLARAGHQRIQHETARHHLRRLIDRLQDLPHWGRHHRPFASLPSAERARRLGLKAMLSTDPHAWRAAVKFLTRANAPALAGSVFGSLASIFATMAQNAPDPTFRADLSARARQYAQRAIEINPANVIHQLRAGELAAADSNFPGAIEHLRTAASLASSQDLTASAPDSLPFPFPFDRFRFLWECAAAQDPETFRITARRLMLARALHGLGHLLWSSGRVSEAIEALSTSVRTWPHLCGNSSTLAQLLASQKGQEEKAIELYRSLLVTHPFDFDTRRFLADLLCKLGRQDEFTVLSTDTFRLQAVMNGHTNDVAPGA
ncbi:MAG: glycosyltransferase [Candidatus Methylomirabilia bacterium]